MWALGRGLLIFSVSLLVTGCFETGAQREAARIQTESKSASDEGKTCIDAAVAKPEYAHLLTKSHYPVRIPPTFHFRCLPMKLAPQRTRSNRFTHFMAMCRHAAV
jgi:hypothetical protein